MAEQQEMTIGRSAALAIEMFIKLHLIFDIKSPQGLEHFNFFLKMLNIEDECNEVRLLLKLCKFIQ